MTDPSGTPSQPQPSQTPPAAPVYGAPTPGAPAYGAPAYGAPAYAPVRTNTLAVVSLISGIAAWVVLPFIGALVAVITGHLSLGQIKRTGESGRGMALAGVIMGWVNIGLAVVFTILLIVLFIALGTGTFGFDSTSSGLNS